MESFSALNWGILWLGRALSLDTKFLLLEIERLYLKKKTDAFFK